MTEVEWPDVRSVTSFSTFLPPCEQKIPNDVNENYMESDPKAKPATEDHPKLPPKLKKSPFFSQPINGSNFVTPSSDVSLPPLIPVKSVASKKPTIIQNGGVIATSNQVPTKMIPVDLKPVTSIFDTINDDGVTSGPKCLKIENVNMMNHLEPEKSSSDLYDGDTQTGENRSMNCSEDSPKTEDDDCFAENVAEKAENGSEEFPVSIKSFIPKENVHGSNQQILESLELNPNDEQENVFMVKISLNASEKRFGFSVIGGSDEGITPKIDTINPGSPADKADLEVGDEILEVNGKTLEDATHTEVISHIHQCIRSRTICLRVKRKLGNKAVLDIAQNSNVQDAFVIAVEQQARDRLEKLSALRKIKPVDMTKLSQELNDSTSPENGEDLNGIIEGSSIYVTSVPELSQNSLQGDQNRRDILIHNSHDGEMQCSPNNGEVITSLPNAEEELELKQDIINNGHSEPINGTRNINIFEAAINDNTNLSMNSEVSNISSFNMENKPHREMAVDVPESFVATAKQSPRYPPPRQNGSAHRIRPYSDYSSSSDRSSTAKPPKDYGGPVKVTHSSSNSIGSSASNSLKKPLESQDKVNHVGSTSNMTIDGGGQIVDDNQDVGQLNRIRKYQEDLKKRKEDEDRVAKEEEFLRSSLRGSRKLQALENQPPLVPPTGVVNTAFQSDDGDESLISESKPKTTSSTLTAPVGPEELQEVLQRVHIQLKSNGYNDDLVAADSLLNNNEFQKNLLILKKIQEIWCFSTPPTPICTNAQDLIQEVLNSLQECALPEATELIETLSKLEFEGLIYTHDKIAERSTVMPLQGDEDILDRVSQYTDDSIKIVRIDKTNEPLGATVRNEGEAVVIGRIVKGGAAEKSGLLHEGDEILEVNGIEMRGKSVNDVCDILATMMGTLTFIIIPTQNERPQTPVRDTVMHVKAHFDYEPDEDLYNPCRELGISFQKGDILHVINQDDPNWWQAYREGEEDQTLAGLIPSKNFQQQREAMKQTIVGDINSKEKSKKAKFLCARKPHKKKKKKVLYNANFNDDTDSEEILTYEEVALHYPRANKKRPIVLIGPPNIGRHELRQKLMEDLQRFAAAIPHTSRQKKDGELDGQDYHFITRSQFECDIVSRKFVEHGEFEKNYYGTSINAIRSVVNSSKICVLNLHPQSLKILKNSDLKPYVVFVAPPSLDKLRQNRAKMGANVKDDELKDIIEKAREMEDNYGHYFDMIIINSDIDKAYQELLKEINILEREPQWVPAVWLHDEINS